MTNEELKRLREIAAASTEGELQYGPFDLAANEGESLQVWMSRTGPDPNLWVTYQNRDDGPYYLAVTGNGPRGEANATFFSIARANTLALIDEVLRLRGELTEIRGTAGLRHA